MSREQNTQPKHDAREVWRSHRRTGESTATFRPGEELRCPGTLRTRGYYGPCGSAWGERAKSHTRVIVRVRAPADHELPYPGTEHKCHRCGASLEKYTIREATE